MEKNPRVAIVAMPWQRVETPSIQLGILTALLSASGAVPIPKSYYLEFAEFCLKLSRAKRAYRSITGGQKLHDGFDLSSYEYVAESSFSSGLGDWLFAIDPLRAPDSARDAEYLAAITDVVPKEVLRAVLPLRNEIPRFLEWCVDDILSDDPDVVGFTTTYTQTSPALHLAMRLKTARPDVKVIFGGANCDTIMGIELHKQFPSVDYVLRGEAELSLPLLVSVLRGEALPESVPGLCHRDAAGNAHANDVAPQIVSMSDVPMPVYDEYFERLAGLTVRKELEARIMLPLETSRGCWWGQKHHCTFCGLNGSTMTFRSKDPGVVKREVLELSSKYCRTHFQTVDNILDLGYFKSLLPWMKEQRSAGNDFTMFYEIKANLRREQVRLLAEAGVRIVQPGIESLSTSILKLMGKGATGIGNIQLLKWGREFGIRVAWNLLYGFPGEDPKEYARIADLVPSLSHLEPPNLAALVIERFSPYFDTPDAFGIQLRGASTWYKYVYDLDDEALERFAYSFEHAVIGRASDRYVSGLADQLTRYWSHTTAGRSSLKYRRGPGFVTIEDRRAGLPRRDLLLKGWEAEAFLACDAASTPRQVFEAIKGCAGVPDARGIATFLESLHTDRLAYEEGGRFLALATAENPYAVSA